MIRNYLLLSKPGIVFGNMVTVVAGFFLGSHAPIDLFLLCWTMVGIGLVMASACVFNNLMDVEIDAQMHRTQNRALVTKSVSPKAALFYGTLLGLLGIALLGAKTNQLTALIALFGFITYVTIYTPLKKRSHFSTAVGSIAGAVPPVVGYTAATNQIDMGAVILFFVLVFWQMAHFLAIALMHLSDYEKANIPLLPSLIGVEKTKKRIIFYIVAFLFVELFLFEYMSPIGFIMLLFAGLLWLQIALKKSTLYGRGVFRFSLVVIITLPITIGLSRPLKIDHQMENLQEQFLGQFENGRINTVSG